MAQNDSIATDPRERLVQVGNELLDVLFELEKTAPAIKRMREVQDSKDEGALSELMKEEGVLEMIIGRIGVEGRRETALREYVTIRRTIEALTGQSSVTTTEVK